MERVALAPLDGPVLVTGATGGVGSIAVQLLSARGHEVWAMTGRAAEHEVWLKELGATEVVDRADFSEPGKPLQKARLGGVGDSVFSEVLANAIAQLRWGGFFFSSRRRHTSSASVSWARRCV